MDLENSLQILRKSVEAAGYHGYDPYDTLNSPFNFKLFGKWGPAVAIQVQKRNPINIRPQLGVQKGLNPKGMGLFLKSYALLYQKTGEEKYLEKARWLFDWLNTNYAQGYSGRCWGYNFDWANPQGTLPAYTPSVVVTSFVVDGIYAYYNVTGSEEARDAVISSARYITDDIPIVELPEGISYSYTHLSKGCCYNASLLAAEVLARADHISGNTVHQKKINRAVDFVLAKQRDAGEWWYSYNPDTGEERKQIDFHQGFVLVSLHNLNQLVESTRPDIESAIARGLAFYKAHQFFPSGQSRWRLPKKWPVDIHNQSQGIITFTRLRHFDRSYLEFAETIACWTIENMQAEKGYFYYRKYPLLTNKINYIRWAQAWMMLALTELMPE